MKSNDTPLPRDRRLTDLNLIRPAQAAARTDVEFVELPRVISLFSGAGGLDLGFKQAGFEISVAIDSAPAAIRTHKRNFPETVAELGDLIKLQPAGVVEIVKRKLQPPQSIAVIGGPPCQGFSRANTAALATDPRNELPSLYLSIVKELKRTYDVEFIVFENVLGIRDRKHLSTYEELRDGIAALGFDVYEQELCAMEFGVPQNRRRIILSCLQRDKGYGYVMPRTSSKRPTVRDTIGELGAPVYFRHGLDPITFPVHENHWTMQPKSPRFTNPEANTGEGRSFKRLKWDEASPTLAFGHREIHVHPNGQRRLSIYESLLLQGFPHAFVLEGNLSEQVEQVSNAVPPPMARGIAEAVILALEAQANG